MIRALPGIVVAWAVSAAAGPAAADLPAPRTAETFVGDGRGAAPQSVLLAHRFVLEGSERVLRGEERLAPEVGYRLDPDAGILLLARPLAEGERLTVEYSWVPVDLPREFVGIGRGEPTPAESTRIARPAELPPADRFERAVESELTIDGAKTVALETGTNRDAAVEQSLRVRVGGRLGSDVTVTALLSDQNIPLQPEGNTQRLQELDEVLVRIESARAAATLGDFLAERRGTAFGDFDRRLSGAQARVSAGGAEVRGAGASTRGTFRSAEFRGVEGKQGPYVLAGSGEVATGVIVGGSERVWLDGRELSRGETGDYVMDYSRGELEFTNRVLITEDSRIAVDFEVAEQPYKRSFWLGDVAAGRTGERFVLRGGVVAETDDHEPNDIVLTAERRAALEAAGDGSVLVPGAVCGLPDGDYDQEGDVFVYAGVDSGTCDVSFTLVGAGAGDYVRDRDVETGFVFFRFVGAGAGDYTPGLSLAPPRSAALFDAGVAVRDVAGFSLAADAALSDEDRNTFSEGDDGDNRGVASRAELAWESPELARWGDPVTLRATGTYRGQSAEFAPIGRTRDAYLGEVWNFADTTAADESVGETQAVLRAGDRWSLGGGLGVLDRAGRFRSERRQGSATWSGARVPGARFSLESVRRTDDADTAGTVEGELRRERADVTTVATGWLRPGLTWWREDRSDERAGALLAGSDDAEIGGNVAIGSGAGPRGELRVARRTTDVVDTGRWVRESVGRTIEARAELPGRSTRLRGSWIRRVLDFADGRPSPDRTTNLTRADLTHESFGGVLSGEWVYETTSRSVTDLLDAESPERPTLAIEASGRVTLGGRRAGRAASGAPAFLRWFRVESLARVEEETDTTDRGPVYLLDFSRFQDEAHTVFGQYVLREELTLLPESAALSVTARWERTDTMDNRAASSRLDLVAERTVVRARTRLDPAWTLSSQVTWQKDAREDSRGASSDFDVRLREIREELAWQASPTARVTGTAAAVRERNERSNATVSAWLTAVAAQTAVRRSGRASAEVTWTHPTDREGIDPLNRFRTEEEDEVEWRGSLELKASESINLSLSYTGQALSGKPTLHFARAEARALF